MKKIEIFGKKVPLFAILIALLVIGTASAAVFLNYATLSGTVDVSNGVSVTDSYGETFEANGEGGLNFNSPATFTINNANDEPAIVNLVTTLDLDGIPVTDYEGLTVDYSVIDGTGVEATDPGTLVLVPPGGLTIDVNFTYEDNVMPGEYNITVAVDYSAEDYITFTGENAMVDVTMSHKNDTWVPIGEPSLLAYAPMGNEFYFELDAVGLDTETPYSLIYYADEVYDETDVPLPDGKNIGDDKWGGTNEPAGTAIGDSFEVASETITGHYNLGMDVPCMPDENFDEGAKVWVILTSDLSGGSLPMDGWNTDDYLFEYSEILDLDYTDLVRYTDTDL